MLAIKTKNKIDDKFVGGQSFPAQVGLLAASGFSFSGPLLEVKQTGGFSFFGGR